eukprot:3341281-Rhodomonas_salina.1
MEPETANLGVSTETAAGTSLPDPAPLPRAKVGPDTELSEEDLLKRRLKRDAIIEFREARTIKADE